MSVTELSNSLLYTKMDCYLDFVRNVHLGDTYVSYNTKSVIIRFNCEMIISITETGKTIVTDIYFAYKNNVPIYKYVGPTTKDLQQKQDTISQLCDCLIDARLQTMEEEGCISFIGEDYRMYKELHNKSIK